MVCDFALCWMCGFLKLLGFMYLSFLCICGVLEICLSFKGEKDVIFLYIIVRLPEPGL